MCLQPAVRCLLVLEQGWKLSTGKKDIRIKGRWKEKLQWKTKKTGSDIQGKINIVNRGYGKGMSDKKRKILEYQVNNKFEKIFIKSCKKMKKGKEKKTKGSGGAT